MDKKYHVGAYYFPNYHFDIKNEQRHGKGWNEWNVLKYATPRFEGHQQPKIPLWGYEDEADPIVMEKKIDIAVAHGVDTFLFDWYYYEDGPYLEKCLEQGFLQAKNVGNMHFSLMWANHDWCNMHPKGLTSPVEKHSNGTLSPDTFEKATDYMIQNYFKHPSYLRIEDGLFLTIYELSGLINTFGGIEETKNALNTFRNKVRIAGLGELHLNAIVWSNKVLPAEQCVENIPSVLKELGFDSVTSYVWVHMHELDSFPAKLYSDYMEECMAELDTIASEYDMPYFPNVTVGWDPSPRTIQSDIYEDVGYPYTPILVNNSPNEFEVALRKAKSYLDSKRVTNFVTINAWNEWTEGSYLEPDTVNGMGYLEAIRNVFSTTGCR